MRQQRSWSWVLAGVAMVVLVATTRTIFAAGQSYIFLQPGFTQEIFGVSSSFFGGVAFAPDGDAWVDECRFDGSPLHRFDLQTVIGPINGTTFHPESTVPSNAGCGLTNHPDGALYSNIDNGSNGVSKLDVNTGAPAAVLGPRGNALGIAVDPQTNHLVYVGQDCRFTATCTIIDLDPVGGTSTNFAVLAAADAAFVDGIAFDPAGNYLFLANRSPVTRLTILDRAGAIVQHVAMTSEPDGIAFHASAPRFVVTNNTDGTMTRFDFPADDFAQPPVQSVFASGGFRGDLSQVGADGCLYVTQDGTRYDDGTVTDESSLVRICGGFAPPPGVAITGNMTGGGRIVASTTATHGFELHCNKNDLPNHLQVNWGRGNRFHLDTLTSASCSDDPAVSPEPPGAPFDTYRGAGSGSYNGVPGATAEWTFVDAGEPGRDDTANIVIKDAANNIVLSISGSLQSGNHQAHR